MINRFKEYLGKSIQSDEIKSLLEELGIKYPKKDSISNKSNNRDFWLISKKQGIQLLFSIEVINKNYNINPGEGKGVFIPILTHITFETKTNILLDSGISYKSNLDECTKALGIPTKSSEISPIWLNDDGSESFYIWDSLVDEEKDITTSVRCDGEDDLMVTSISLHIREDVSIISLYDNLLGSDIKSVLKAKNSFYTKKNLFFIHWLLFTDRLYFDKKAQSKISDLKSNKIDLFTYLEEYYHPAYIGKLDIKSDSQFIRFYINNTSGNDIVFQRDFAMVFLQDPENRQNSLGNNALLELSKVGYTEKNLELIHNVINTRLEEYNKHSFAESVSVLEYKG